MPSSISLYKKLIPVVLFVLFVSITAPGIAWGTPSIWHPDEQVKVADRALNGLTVIDTRNFNYPSLPKYTMYWLGWLMYRLGLSRAAFLQAARLVSVTLGGLIVATTYAIALASNASLPAAIFSALLALSSSEMALNARFAHVDIYLVFFSCLSALLLLKYSSTHKHRWLYASFLTVGLAASSKYNGLSLIVAVILVYLMLEKNLMTRRQWFRLLRPLAFGLLLTFAGFVIGTPRMLLAPSMYIPRVMDALFHHATFDFEAGDQIALFGQWRVLIAAHGLSGFLIYLIAMIWGVAKLIRYLWTKNQTDRERIKPTAVILACLLALNLPILISYNYPERFFLPLLPSFAVLTGLFFQDLYILAHKTGHKLLNGLVITLACAILILASLRVLSVGLLFFNDNRIAASRYLETLPRGSSVEYTLYPPNLPAKGYKKFNYPIFFLKFADAQPPQGKSYQFNQGEPGIEERRPDYFIIDSFTYSRFDDPNVCQELPDECAFFKRLLAGETNYQLMQTFDYHLPRLLPQLQPKFLNPVIRVFQRKSGV